MTLRLGLIDYGMGNLHSVGKAFTRINQNIDLVKRPSDINNFDSLILPGVGSFDPAMDNLEKTGLIPYIKEWVKKDKPLLGICLGLQLLFESSEEGKSKGLGLLKGHVGYLPKDQKERIPHMGWSILKFKNKCPLIDNNNGPNWVYFVHSFAAFPSQIEDLAATTQFGNVDVTAIVWKNNIGACQFHPEKSGITGQKLLLNWVEWLKRNK